jgi:peptide/nickel transport system permease protein
LRIASYLLGRSVRGVLTLLTMIAIGFALYFAVERQPPVADYFPTVQKGAPATKQQTDLVRHLFYLDRSKVGMYFTYLGHLAEGDLGHTKAITLDAAQNGHIVDAGPVAPYQALRVTLSILIGGAVLVLLLALPLGAISGTRIGSWTDRAISFGALVLVCTHPMMLGLILKSVGGKVSWLPTSGYCTFLSHNPPSSVALPNGTVLNVPPSYHPCGGPKDWATHLILPWLTFALLFLALYTRMIRASVAETIHEDFVRTARAKGASQMRVVGRHVLPSAGLRVLTMVGMEIGTAIGVCVYIESAYSDGGLGSLAVNTLGGGLGALNLPQALAVIVLITLIVVVGNLVVDMLYVFLDPRVGLQRGQQRTKSLVGGVF